MDGSMVDHPGDGEADALRAPRIAILLPCLDEAASIAQVIDGFRKALPEAAIYVYDNNSTDGTGIIAAAAGATVRHERLQGKGQAVRRMFADIEADIYLLADGDLTYDAGAARQLIDRLIADNLDMVVGARVGEGSAFRNGHRFGNRLFTETVRTLFGPRFTDILSGYRAMSRRFVKTFPGMARGFEIETELSVHALELDMAVAEIPTRYATRPQGSTSKLHTVSDGLRILITVLRLVKAHRPLWYFGAIAAVLTGIAALLALPILETYAATGLVPRFPTAFGIVGILVLASLSLASGMILDSLARVARETKRLHYLGEPSLRSALAGAGAGAEPTSARTISAARAASTSSGL